MRSSHHIALSRFLARLRLNSVLSRAEEEAVMALTGQTLDYGSGRDLVRPGDTISGATLIADGHVGRFDLMRDGARQITAIYIAGDMCDLYSVVAPTTGWGLTALGNATIVQTPHAELRDLALAFPNLALAFWRDTVLDASIIAKWVGNIGRKDARARIAHLFCECGVRTERASLGRRDDYELALTQEQIGDATGLTAVHVNRMLKELKQEGVMTFQARRVAIPDWDRLARIAEFSPTYLLCGEDMERAR